MKKNNSGEFDIIKIIKDKYATSKHSFIKQGSGDDCAVFFGPKKYDYVVTTDTLVSGVHFDEATFSWDDIGYKALAVNVSDVYAMGATPCFYLASVVKPPHVNSKDLIKICKGMKAFSKEVSIDLIGGNLTQGKELSVTITCFGTVPQGLEKMRSGAKIGDKIYVAGELGQASLGLKILQTKTKAKNRNKSLQKFIRAQKRPQLVHEIAKEIVQIKSVSSLIDVSDGLLQDLGHILKDSCVSAEITTQFLKMPDDFVRCAKNHGCDPYDLVLNGGEDYALLFTAPAGDARIKKMLQSHPQKVRCLGDIVATKGKESMIKVDGQSVKSNGFDHFKRNIKS